MRAEKMIYEFTCDGCGDAEGDEVDDLPVGWVEDGEEHFCQRCAVTGGT